MLLASFYIGTLLLIPALIVFLRTLNPNKNLLAFSLLFLALYNGAGSYHGFFWVVPSFFALLLFFLLFSVFKGHYKHWKIYSFILIPLMIYTHFIGLYLIFILPLFTLFYSLFKKEIDLDLFKKLGFILFITVLFYVPTAFYLRNSPYGGNPYGIETLAHLFVNSASKYVSSTPIKNSDGLPLPPTSTNMESTMPFSKTLNQTLFPGFHQIKTDYFDWIFPHWVAVLFFLFLTFLLIYYEQYALLSLYLAALSFTLLSSISIYGIRSLLLTWPLTFLVYGYGAWFFFILVREKIKDGKVLLFAQGLATVAICCFVLINVIYSYSWNHDPSTISIKALINNL